MSKQSTLTLKWQESGDGESADSSVTYAGTVFSVQNVTSGASGQQVAITVPTGAKIMVVIPPTTSTTTRYYTDGNDFGEGGVIGTSQPFVTGVSGLSTVHIGTDDDGGAIAETLRVVFL